MKLRRSALRAFHAVRKRDEKQIAAEQENIRAKVREAENMKPNSGIRVRSESWRIIIPDGAVTKLLNIPSS